MLKLWENPMLSIEERLEVASGEIERLQGLTDAVRNAVEKANEQAERFEREWYLRGDALDEALDFGPFKIAVAKQFERMKKHDLFKVDVEKDAMWDTYLGSFPPGTNPVFRERTEHDCTCCKQFIRAVGNVVAIVDGKVESIWDIEVPSEPGYQAVADALSKLVKSKPICDIFMHDEKTAGTDKNFQQVVDGTLTWEHFFVNIPTSLVVKRADLASALAGPRTQATVFRRALDELTDDSVDMVLELVAQNSLYRGQENKFALVEFRKAKTEYNALSQGERDSYTWTKVKHLHGAVLDIRNSAIGTLLINLSKGVELEDAVKMFETSVACPTNYKRPTALVTKDMIERARKKISELGLTSALERRYATIDDITINNIVFADRKAKKALTHDVFDEVASDVKADPKKFDRVEEVTIEKFLADILPKAESIEVMFENRHASNLVSLIAPVDPTAGRLFKWDNNFSWSYNGAVADSIKERVKAAGGSVTGDLCCRLAWEYKDDLDFWMTEPNGFKIYFSNRRQKSGCGGMLDLDANGADGQRDDPAENIFYSDRRHMMEGVYTLSVHNFSRRSDGKGFEVEIEFDGNVHRIGYDNVLRDGAVVQVAKIKYTKAGGFEIIESLPSSQSVRTEWGIKSQTFQKVNVVMMSPNFWDEKAVGNKHYFFMIDGCINEGGARPFFNEFLKEDFTEHRKVFEMVAGKAKVKDSDAQLSGLGFSSTQRNEVLCRVNGSFSRVVKIVF